MADSKLTALTEETAPVDADLLYLVDDVAGTPTSKKITWANVKAAIRSALVSDTAYGSGWNGVTDVAPSKNAVYDKIESLFPAATAYTPTWTADSVNPSLGNGTLKGAYIQFGKLLFLRGSLVFGSTTSAGTGGWLMTLPASITARTDTAIRQAISLWAYDSSATSLVPGVARIDTGGTTMRFQTAAAFAGNVGPAQPWAWANGDELQWSGVIEID